MTLRPARLKDHPAIAAFLRGYEPSSIFPLSNLEIGGAQQLWLAETAGVLQGVVALGSSGFLMPQWPGGDWQAVAAALTGQRLGALTGPADQVDGLITALGIAPTDLRHIGHEPLCTLNLAALQTDLTPDFRLLALTPKDTDLAIQWRMAFDAETLAQPAATARTKAAGDVARWLTSGSHRLLWQGSRPVALTGINARLPDVVQVGGVFVPPDLRNQGFARRAVAAHLAEARMGGAERAVLFAANPAALAAYRAIGFDRVGTMGLALLHQPRTLP